MIENGLLFPILNFFFLVSLLFAFPPLLLLLLLHLLRQRDTDWWIIKSAAAEEAEEAEAEEVFLLCHERAADVKVDQCGFFWRFFFWGILFRRGTKCAGYNGSAALPVSCFHPATSVFRNLFIFFIWYFAFFCLFFFSYCCFWDSCRIVWDFFYQVEMVILSLRWFFWLKSWNNSFRLDLVLMCRLRRSRRRNNGGYLAAVESFLEADAFYDLSEVKVDWEISVWIVSLDGI